MGARFFTSHWDFQMMGTNYLLNTVVNKNWWEQLDLSQNQWVYLHPLTYPNDDDPDICVFVPKFRETEI